MTTTPPDVSTAAGILRLGNAFCDAKALLTAVELDLFTQLQEAPSGGATAEEIKGLLSLHGRGLSDFLDLLVALKVLQRTDGVYRNAPGTAKHLVRTGDAYVGGFLLRSSRNLYPAWGRLEEALRTGKQQSGSHYDEVTQNPAILRQFIGSMDAFTNVLGAQLIEAFDWSGFTSVLDVGGARGNLCSQIVKAQPHLAGHVFDLPEMAPFAKELAEELGIPGKVEFHGGSFFSDPLPQAEIVVMGHVLHDWDPSQRSYLIHKAYDAVLPGGTLLVYDRMLDDEPEHAENLVISLDMLLVTDGGSEYPAAEIVGYAEHAGFAGTEVKLLGDYDTLVVARKAA
ncbi:methyltransferase [Streptomyces sp. SID13666]|uniref:methyltransferase n=1 Tax=unclassified Streptomyces TaxID=2593676 RepID=UPI0011072582|nr:MULTISPECIES: methyltransferase [unclassified Streptomyces]MCZ4097858.1 methyltransferase [Streptomyces sp. H39-C1]NEA57525.1 methyltransferase [Streptomyces sp. SID13666]NEA70971.1 methyltransferase [Streptomyces sp. SID13588]QNA76735.1 methyltransferase [Streptomyces sp. So13.3]